MAPNIGIDNSISDDARSESPSTIDDVHDNNEVAKHTPQDDEVDQLLTPSTERRYQFNQNKSQFELNSPSNHKEQPTSHEKQLQATLSSILILDSPTNSPVESLLSSYNGQLIPIGTNILLGLRNAAPTSLAARVGDYNENLFYEMEKKDMDLESIIRASTSSTSTTNNNNGLDVSSTLQQELTSFETTLRQTLQHENISYRGSFMQTESTMYQPAHVDYDYSILSKYGSKLFLAFFPLTEEGAYLQLWQDDENVSIDNPRKGTVVFIPYGNMLIMPSDTIHGGGFKRGEGGNLRFHLYIEILEDEEVAAERGVEEKKEVTNNIALLDHPMNKYTEKYDRRRELCERFVDANGLDKLLGVFFDTDDGVQHNEESPVGKVQEDIEAISSLAKLVKKKGQNLPSTKSANKLDLHGTEIISATRKSPSSVNLFGLTELTLTEEVV